MAKTLKNRKTDVKQKRKVKSQKTSKDSSKKAVQKSSHKNTRANHKPKTATKKKMSTSKRNRLLMACVAPKVIPTNHLIFPLNDFTRGTLFSPNQKIIYAELYTLFNTSSLIQLDTKGLAKAINAKKKLAQQVTLVVNLLIKMKLVSRISVYNPKDKRRKTPIGYVLKNTGLTSTVLSRHKAWEAIHKDTKATKKHRKLMLKYDKIAQRVIDYLNKQFKERNVKKKFNCKGHSLFLIKKILSLGYSEKDFKTVIDNKFTDWFYKAINGKPMREYLRPTTLFASKHFDNYLNEDHSGEALNIGQQIAQSDKDGDDTGDFF